LPCSPGESPTVVEKSSQVLCEIRVPGEELVVRRRLAFLRGFEVAGDRFVDALFPGRGAFGRRHGLLR